MSAVVVAAALFSFSFSFPYFLFFLFFLFFFSFLTFSRAQSGGEASMRAKTPGSALSRAEAHAARSSAASRRARQEQAAGVRGGWFLEREREVQRWRSTPRFFRKKRNQDASGAFADSPIHAPEASARASPTLCEISINISGGRSSSVVTGGALRARGVGGQSSASVSKRNVAL